jgi:hypothetical protein
MSHKTSKITGSSTLFHQPQVMVPPREARCFEVPKGHFFRICCVEGPQVVGRWVAAAVLKKALQLIISYHNKPYPIHIIHYHTISSKIAYQNENTLGPIIWIHMMSNQNILRHIMSYHDISNHVKPEHVLISYHTPWYIIPSQIRTYCISTYHIKPEHIVSYHAGTYNII